MGSQLKGSKTEQNLIKSFAGESQALENCPVCLHPKAFIQAKE